MRLTRVQLKDLADFLTSNRSGIGFLLAKLLAPLRVEDAFFLLSTVPIQTTRSFGCGSAGRFG